MKTATTLVGYLSVLRTIIQEWATALFTINHQKPASEFYAAFQQNPIHQSQRA
jgi:hypothetical protein